MNIENSGADRVRVSVLTEGLQHFHAGASGFHGDDIGIQRDNGGQDVFKLAVAHMCIGP